MFRGIRLEIQASGIACVILSTTKSPKGNKVVFARYASSALVSEFMACLKAITWARNAGHMHIAILIDSYNLVQLLRLENYKDITVR